MANEQLVQRLIAQETGIDTHHLRTGKLTEDELAALCSRHRGAGRHPHVPG